MIAGIDDLKAYTGCSFSEVWVVDDDVSAHEFVGEIWDVNGVKKADLTIVSDSHQVSGFLTETQVTALGIGTFNYAIKEIVTAETDERPFVFGKLVVLKFKPDTV